MIRLNRTYWTCFLRNCCGCYMLFFLWPGILSAQVVFTSSNLPIVVIETDSQEIVDDPRIVADMGIIWNGEGQINHLSDPLNHYSGKISIEYRGASSQMFQKKSYGFDTQDILGENRNVSLLGLPAENDWVLYGPYSDKSLIRNILSYRLARELGQYAPRTRLCELVVNGDYRGVYVLIEKIKRDKNRVDIAKLKPDEIEGEDLTGGYIIKVDKLIGNAGPAWTTEQGGIYFQYEYPKYDVIAEEQKAYIRDYLDELEYALTADYFTDPLSGYRKYLDAGSAVDMFIINELSKNVDGYFQSTFLYKKADRNGGMLYLGPAWDFNLSFGVADYREAYRTEGFQIDPNPAIWWWDRLLLDSAFIRDIRERWAVIRENQFSDANILAIIDSLAHTLGRAQQRNFTRWNILNYNVWPNYHNSTSYKEEINYLKTWTLQRLQWLDETLGVWTGLERAKELFQVTVYPNPFKESMRFQFNVRGNAHVTLTLYDLNGSEVERIISDEIYPGGEFTVEWHAPDIPESIYVLVLKIDGVIAGTQKIIKLN
jgi:hypothetical protein